MAGEEETMEEEFQENAALTQAARETEETPERPAGYPAGELPYETADTAAVWETDKGEPGATGVSVRFNHRQRILSGEEAAVYAQKGLKWEAFQDDYDRLRFLAEGTGQSVSAWIHDQCERDRQRETEEVLARCGDEETARQLVELRRRERAQRFQSAADRTSTEEQSEQEAQAQRLAGEYDELCRVVPDVGEFASLPETVIREAVEREVPLLYTYLRFCYEQERQTAAEKTRAANCAAASTGSLRGGPVREPGSGSQAFLSAFEGAFG